MGAGQLLAKASVSEDESESDGAGECTAYVYALKHQFRLPHPRATVRNSL